MSAGSLPKCYWIHSFVCVSHFAKYRNKCVSKTHIDKRKGAVNRPTTFNSPAPFFKGNISIADCRLLSSLLKTMKINGCIDAGMYENLAILDEYPVDHCCFVTVWTTVLVYTTSATTVEAVDKISTAPFNDGRRYTRDH